MSNKEKIFSDFGSKGIPLYPLLTSPSLTPLALIKRNKELVDTLRELGLSDNVVFDVLCKTYGYEYLTPINDNEIIASAGSDLQGKKRHYQRVVMAIKAAKTCLNRQEISDDTKELLRRDIRMLERQRDCYIVYYKGMPCYKFEFHYRSLKDIKKGHAPIGGMRGKDRIAFAGKRAKTLIQVKACQIRDLYGTIKPLANRIPYGHYNSIQLFDLIGELFEVTRLYDKHGGTLSDNSANRIQEYYNNDYNKL